MSLSMYTPEHFQPMEKVLHVTGNHAAVVSGRLQLALLTDNISIVHDYCRMALDSITKLSTDINIIAKEEGIL